MRDNTLIVFQSDNGGTRNPMFAGEVDMSKIKSLPPDNGPYRDGKGTLYEGGTRVVALANWPGQIKPGTVVDEMIHEVDMYPTLLGLAGASDGEEPSRSTASTSGGRSAKASPPRAPRSSTTSSRSAPACARATGSSSGGRRCRRRSSSTTSPRTRRRRTTSPPRIPTRWLALQKRANELATVMVPPLMFQTEVKAMKSRCSLPPADVLDGAAE